MESLLVCINTDPPEKIAALYNVGEKRARNIVGYRSANGPFKGPEDLAKVKGVGLDLATTLSPWIDWNVPNTTPTINRPWWLIGLALVLLVVSVALQFLIYPTWKSALSDWVGSSEHRILVGSLLLLLISGSVAMLPASCLVFVAVMARTEDARFRIMKVVVWAVCVVFGALAVFGVISDGAIAVALLTGGSLQPFMFAWFAATGIIWLIAWSLCGAILWPSLGTSAWLSRPLDAAVLLGASFAAWLVWQHRYHLPILDAVVLIPSALILIGAAMYAILTHTSLFGVFCPGLQRALRKVSPSHNWQSWVNAPLPGVEQQKALMEALQQAHRRSKWDTMVNVIILGAGGWLLVTVLEAVIHWLIHNWLNAIVH
jgi:competence ComEA-like helix-hairpin-helix protein